MSTMTIGSRHPEALMLMVPATGFAKIVAPFWRDEETLTRAAMDWERRWQTEWERRNVED